MTKYMKKAITTLTVSAALLTIMPFLALLIDTQITHLGIMLIAFSCVSIYPIYYLIVVIVLGEYTDKIISWVLPICSTVFMFITNLIVSSAELLIYSVVYVVISYITMAITHLIYRTKKKTLINSVSKFIMK